jgi:hypothetical protein
MTTPIPSLADALAQSDLLHGRGELDTVIADMAGVSTPRWTANVRSSSP